MKRFISLLLTLLMLISSVPMTAFSAFASSGLKYDTDGDGESFAIEVESKTIQSADTEFTADINFVENTGVWAFKFYLVYDKALSIASNSAIVKGDVFTDFNPNTDVGLKNKTHEKMLSDVDYADSLANAGLEGNTDWLVTSIYSECADPGAWSTDTGRLCTVTFNIDPASEKDEYTVYAIPATGGWILREEPDHPNADEGGYVEIFDPACIPGTITVEGVGGDEPDEPVYTEPTIVVSDAEIEKGTETANFTINVYNNPGFCSFMGFINYDEQMSLANFVNGDIFPYADLFNGGPMAVGNEVMKDISVADHKTALQTYEAIGASYDGVLATQVYFDHTISSWDNITTDGEIASFTLNTAVLEAGTYEIAFYFDEFGIIDAETLETVPFDAVYGTLTVVDTICDHEYDEGVVTTAPTCTENGEKIFTCSACGETYTEIIDATGHDFPEVTGASHVFCQTCETEKLPDEEGMCGDNIYYEQYYDTGVLVIYGEGAMNDYYSSASAPWYNSRSSIKTVIIGDGVTSIGNRAFEDFTFLTSVAIPDSVTNIGNHAFYGCDSLTSITIPDSVTSIRISAFYNTAYYNNSSNWENGVLYISNHLIVAKTSISGDYTIREGTKCIGDYAFEDCTSLTSITIPDSVTSIGMNAFYNTLCYNSDSNWENGVFYISNHLINAKNSISGDYTIRKGTKCIADYAFDYCDSLTSIAIPDSVTSIGIGTFYECTSLTSINIPDSVTSIGEWAFCDCTSLVSITIPDSVTSIGEWAFYGCDSLKSITIPDSVTSIGEYAFKGCGSLTTVYFTGTEEEWNNISIGSDNNCLTSANIQYNYSDCDHEWKFDNTILPGCTTNGSTEYICTVCGDKKSERISALGHEYIKCESVAPTCEEDGYTEYACIRCDESYFDDIVVAVGHNYIEEIVSATCTENGEKIFTCSACGETYTEIINATGHDFPEVKGADHVFCQVCEAEKLPDEEGQCGNSVYYELYYDTGVLVIYGEGSTNNYYSSASAPWYNSRSNIKTVIIEDGVTSIGSSAFRDCTSLESITIPDSVTSIGFSAFEECTSLVSITIPDSVTSIGFEAFYRCTSLTSITIPDSVTSIDYDTFYDTAYYNDDSNWNNDMLYISKILIAAKDTISGKHFIREGTRCIAEGAFIDCVSLTEISIPDSVTIIGGWAFAGCHGLTNITIPNGIKAICEYTFYDCENLTSITIPDSVTSIGDNAFAGCNRLTNITIPNGIKAICEDTFSYCRNLTSITIPDSVTVIEDSAFRACDSLELVYYSGSKSDWTNINIDSDNDCLINARIEYNCNCKHEWMINNIILPECETEGVTDYICSVCGNEKTEMTAPPIGHTYNDGVVTSSTCTEQGYTEYSCIRCSHSYNGNFTDPIGHTYSDGVVTSSTCSKQGYTKYSCIRCDHSYDDNFTDPVGHDFDDGKQIKAPTCTEKGEWIKTCQRENCDGIITIENDRLPSCTGSSYTNSMYVAFTYSYPGAESMTISFSEKSYLEEGFDRIYVYEGDPATGICYGPYTGYLKDISVTVNSNSFTIKMKTDETVTAYGFEVSSVEAQLSGSAIDKYYTSALGHSYEYILTPPTCAVKGYTTYTCTVCGDQYISDIVDALGHSYIDEVIAPTCTEKGYTLHTCEVCSDHYSDTFVEMVEHEYGEWSVITDPTCTALGEKVKSCINCGSEVYEDIEMAEHSYETEIVPPTFLNKGYTVFTCTACGESHQGDYVDPLERTDLYDTRVYLEYTSVYYEGVPLTPKAFVTYNGVTYDSSEELSVTYIDNNKVGTATAIVEGINRFKGIAHVVFTISYEHIPEQIVNVIAIGEIGKISLSWGKSNEVSTDSYNIYRKAEDESEYQLIKTVSGRDILSYEDKNVEKDKSYSYYVTGVGLYGAESEPSIEAFATAQRDRQAPAVLKITPSDKSIVNASVKLYTTATDNVAVTKVAYFYSADEGASWSLIGETVNKDLSLLFDTTVIDTETVKIKSVAYDGENNESSPLTVEYTIDNKGPEKVEGLSAETLSSKITLSWNDVTANDAAYFILETKSEGEWKTVASKITTLGYTVTGLKADTDYIYRVACVDLRGNIGEYSEEFTARTAIDETAPVITSQGPNSSRYNSTVKFSATAKDDCDIASIDIQVSTDRKVWKDVSTKTYEARSYKQTYSYTVDLDGYAEGSIYVRAVATDFTGNISDTGDTAPYIEYIIDRTAPSAPKDVTANGNDGYITVSWSMGEELDLGGYYVYKSTSLEGNYQLIASNLSSLNYHDRNVQSGREFYYKVVVSDTCGNMSAPSTIVSSTMAEDAQKPAITGISKTYDQKISESSHTINVSASDNNKLSYITVEYSYNEDGEYVQLVRKDSIDSHYDNISIELPIEDMEDGDVIYIRAYTADMAGLVSDTVTTQYTFDGTAPGISNYELTSENDRVTLTWSDCGEKDLAGFKVYRHEEGGAPSLIGSRGAAVQGEYTFVDTIKTTESKTYYYTVTAIDKLGNEYSVEKSCEYTYVYVNTAPEAVMDMPAYMTVGVEDIFYAVDSYDNNTIVEYIWDFGDGTTSNEIMPIKKYDEIGTYTVTLTVIDNEGLRSSVSRALEVKEREELGTITVKVVDDSGKKLSYVPVYFDLGSDSQRIVYTDASGCATAVLTVGTHVIGTYSNGYLPVKKEVVVLSNATRTVTLTTVEQELVTGEFEITRMTFDEIVAAGIDIYDPANQNVYSATVRVTYGSTSPLTIEYVRNDDKIISYTVKDSEGKPVTYYTNSNGENRKITGITYIPSSTGGISDSDVVAILDIPATASYLKEFFDVKLHIINNASPEFVLENNEVILNVPDGMTLMNSVTGSYLTSNKAYIDRIRGQETVTLSWVLRGDTAGEYDLSADFTGTLAEFNELVTARFETKEPIKVYGLEGIKFRILAADEIHNDALYFNIELENQRDIDIYMPSIGVTDKIKNVTQSVLYNNAENDFFAEPYILNAYIQSENGLKQYIPITYDANGRATTDIEVLAPGQKLVYEYVAYNAINYRGIAYFQEATIVEFEGILENIETGSFDKEFYSFEDYSEKLQDILSGADFDVSEAFEYISNKDNYYYVDEAEDILTSVCYYLYGITDLALSGDISLFTQEEERELIKEILVSMLADSGSVSAVEGIIAQKYLKSVKTILSQTKLNLINRYEDYSNYWEASDGVIDGEDAKFPLDEFPSMEGKDSSKYFDDVFNSIANDEISLAIIYMRDGEEAFVNALQKKLYGYGIGTALNHLNVDNKAAFREQLTKGKMLATEVIDALNTTEQDAYLYSVLKLECNAEYCNYVLDAVIKNTTDPRIISVALELKETVNTTMSEFEYKIVSFCENFASETTKFVAQDILKGYMDVALSATPLVVLKVVRFVFDAVNMDSYYKQHAVFDVYNSVGTALSAAFIDVAPKANDLRAQGYAMCILKSLCEIRLSGELEFRSFMDDYMDGKYAYPLSEEKVLKQINSVKNTNYTSVEEWWDDVQYKILYARDVLFNIEDPSFVIPDAPVVTLDYELMQTSQSFSEEYEYCFADGVWIAAEGKPISFECGTVPGVLRVRVAAGDENLAGRITTVKIYAKKDLSKLIDVKYDGDNYIVSGLSSTREYQIFFTDSEETVPVWEAAVTVKGDDSAVEIFGIDEYEFAIIRSCHAPELEETYSNLLTRTVVKKLKMKLTVDGEGSVVQTDASGWYFPGDTIYLTAVVNEGYEFEAWYVNGKKVSTATEYIVEMEEGLSVYAEFTKDPEAGDTNADGVINSKDTLLLKRYICGNLSESDFAYQYADLNGDGIINMRDSLLMKLKLIKG